MARRKVSFSLTLSALVLLLIVLIVWQYSGYFKQRQLLISSEQQSRQRLLEIESFAQRELDFSERLADLHERYQALRGQLPVELEVGAFRRWLEEQFQAQGLGIQAQREARYTRQDYQEVRFFYSLLGPSPSVQRLVRQLQAQPRMVVIRGVEKESDKSSGLVFSIFSSPVREEAIRTLPACHDKPDALLFRFLNTELDLLYADYLSTCLALNENRDRYCDIQHYHHLNESVQRLQAVYDSLVSPR